jgi:hypothetical protein
MIGSGLPDVEPAPRELSEQCRGAIADYGDEMLIPLPDQTWETSVAAWTGSHWECLVDLWTEPSGRSDLVLHAEVREDAPDYRFAVHLVYVP